MSEFKAWMTAMGYHGKQVTEAGETIGLGQSSSRERYRGEKRPDLTERLAMAAVAVGLPAWSSERHRELQATGQAVAVLREIMADAVSQR